jgi:hypothetical protein
MTTRRWRTPRNRAGLHPCEGTLVLNEVSRLNSELKRLLSDQERPPARRAASLRWQAANRERRNTYQRAWRAKRKAQAAKRAAQYRLPWE